MRNSADSCDSETTVTSFVEDLVTPIAQDKPYFHESEEESLTPLQKGRAKAATVAECGTVENTGYVQSTCSPDDHIAESTKTEEDLSSAQTVELIEKQVVKVM
ncbi:Hypothetical predicted protein [Marmota monax]|uniref:Uncharacterized protein n=1 Tax=Marmota monax TaxID=9995 RepID=A0A5E4D8E3_MARMO|nr:hypothetical protein GHT09_017879 [Marmota monax]VTJ89990.1 Hypothetical predicted protein [Marmota monax]